MGEKMKFTVYVDSDLVKMMKLLGVQMDKDLSGLMAEAMAAYLEANKDHVPRVPGDQ
ncbi:hypothetical protein [Acetonema longum]|uniref:RH3 domain-containing protein n=1 Tax=Acetonema longum DSM 6540 TaxID=1009370 RepID=F7NEJ0_9FIRM|nr:hypothetical protein [Acetonema longum]EGO65401.1 hypothetical protein ALO_02266 [Acetonema longum DSM 6540]